MTAASDAPVPDSAAGAASTTTGTEAAAGTASTSTGTDSAAGTDERRRLVGRAGVVAVGTLLSRVLGLGRDLVLAATFAPADTDLFFVAFTIPNALRQLLAEGALSSAFLPVLSQVQAQEGPRAAAAFYGRMIRIMAVVLVLTCAAGMLGSQPLCELFAAGFHHRATATDPTFGDAFARTVRLTRWLFPYLLCMGLAALGAAALQSRRRFAVAALTPALLNVAIIGSALLGALTARHLGVDPLMFLAIGALIGGVLQVGAQVPALRREGFGRTRGEASSAWYRDRSVREVFWRMLPMTLGLMIYEVDLVLSRRFLSEAGEGANSYFFYAQRLCDFPQGVFALALSTATLPSLAKLHAEGRRDEFARTAEHALTIALAVGLPATAFLVGLSDPIIAVLFRRGAFGATSVHQTAAALAIQGLGVVLVAAIRQLVPIYYALGDTKTPVWISGLDLGVFVALACVLSPTLRHLGVSWAVTGSSAAQLALLALLLPRALPEVRWREPGTTLLTAGLASGLAGTAAAVVVRGWSNPWLALISGAAVFSAVLVLVASIVSVPTWNDLARKVLDRIGRLKRRPARSARAPGGS